jgi:hypothetical protein
MNGRMTILACITGFLLDCMFGDPVWMYHPIRVIGNLISVLEKGLRKLLCSRIPASEQKKKNKREVLAGGILWILTVSLSFLVPAVLLFAAGKVHPATISNTPIITPTNGKKHIAYLIFFSFQSTRGIGILEYIAIAMIIAFNNHIFLTPHLYLSSSYCSTLISSKVLIFR